MEHFYLSKEFKALEDYTKVETLPDGDYYGFLSGCIMKIANEQYKCPFGIKQIRPVGCYVSIKNNEVIDYRIGKNKVYGI